LRKVLAFGDRLEKKAADRLDEQSLDYLDRMRNASRRMQTLINDLLTFSRVSTDANPFAEVELKTIAEEVLIDLENQIDETGASIEIGELPVIEADPTQMRQLLQNLISNGLKYRKPGTAPRIQIFARLHAAEENLPPLRGTASLLYVIDDGIGFEEKYIDRIFTVFQRLHGRNEYPGTGVGLAICRKIAERHNGWITAQSIPGEGSTFIVGLPHKQRIDS
ncbi:MAG TPA: ATP-binding protein, partial [Opitutales bacterium]|nr:ATP-binding protein [Opitutales bacterium]